MSNEIFGSASELDDDMLDVMLSGDMDLEEMEIRHTTDARRKLEERMEELRLRREMKEFDFDD